MVTPRIVQLNLKKNNPPTGPADFSGDWQVSVFAGEHDDPERVSFFGGLWHHVELDFVVREGFEEIAVFDFLRDFGFFTFARIFEAFQNDLGIVQLLENPDLHFLQAWILHDSCMIRSDSIKEPIGFAFIGDEVGTIGEEVIFEQAGKADVVFGSSEVVQSVLADLFGHFVFLLLELTEIVQSNLFDNFIPNRKDIISTLRVVVEFAVEFGRFVKGFEFLQRNGTGSSFLRDMDNEG